MTTVKNEVESFMEVLIKRNPGQHEFHQAVREVIESVMPLVMGNEGYRKDKILERLTEPDRIITFRVTWEDDQGELHVNRAWRVQFNNAIGPYKGGLRFHPTVTQSVLKFLGFEQIFKNSLTGLPMGGAKGGSDFDPKGRSDREVMRFCQSLMVELHRHIGDRIDVPAGDIGVGAREISYLFGMYKRMNNRFEGVLTGKGVSFGGSLGRTEATGHGTVYFTRCMLEKKGDSIEGKTCAVSGSGNVALYCIQKLIQLGGKVVTASDSGGFVHDPTGFTEEKFEWLRNLKEEQRGRISAYAEKFDGVEYYEGKRPWGIPVDLAFACATQNEIEEEDAKTLLDNGVIAVAEGANMPCTAEATYLFLKNKILYGPGKAANAGGVAVSGLEQSQNAQRLYWSREEVDRRLQVIMNEIHDRCVNNGEDGNGWVDYVKGANIGGFKKVAEALSGYGSV